VQSASALHGLNALPNLRSSLSPNGRAKSVTDCGNPASVTLVLLNDHIFAVRIAYDIALTRPTAAGHFSSENGYFRREFARLFRP